jgi:hypothetical protein
VLARGEVRLPRTLAALADVAPQAR